MNGNIRVGSLFGIPFFVNPSWFLILGLVTWQFGEFLAAQFTQLGPGLPWLLGLVAALLMFSSVLAHELGHSFVAIYQGIEVKSITLFLFGGLASLDSESKSPAGAFWVAIAGPLVSLALFALLTFIGVTVSLSAPLETIVGLLAYINLVLALFNLIPGLPLDGGNILKALVWKITGNPQKGVVFASRVGQFIGWMGISFGVLSILGLSQFGSLWTLLIGIFLLQNAGRMAQSATLQEQLMKLSAVDALLPENPIVRADLSLREFANEHIIGSQQTWRRFLVVDDNGQLLGGVDVEAMKTVPTSQWPEITVRDLMTSEDTPVTIQATAPLLDAAKLIEEKQVAQVIVVREDGALLGLLKKASIFQALQAQMQDSGTDQRAPASTKPDATS